MIQPHFFPQMKVSKGKGSRICKSLHVILSFGMIIFFSTVVLVLLIWQKIHLELMNRKSKIDEQLMEISECLSEMEVLKSKIAHIYKSRLFITCN